MGGAMLISRDKMYIGKNNNTNILVDYISKFVCSYHKSRCNS